VIRNLSDWLDVVVGPCVPRYFGCSLQLRQSAPSTCRFLVPSSPSSSLQIVCLKKEGLVHPCRFLQSLQLPVQGSTWCPAAPLSALFLEGFSAKVEAVGFVSTSETSIFDLPLSTLVARLTLEQKTSGFSRPNNEKDRFISAFRATQHPSSPDLLTL
jgi:hypothetical protein